MEGFADASGPSVKQLLYAGLEVVATGEIANVTPLRSLMMPSDRD
jgi:hypothetical protein